MQCSEEELRRRRLLVLASGVAAYLLLGMVLTDPAARVAAAALVFAVAFTVDSMLASRAARCGVVLRDERSAYIEAWAANIAVRVAVIAGLVASATAELTGFDWGSAVFAYTLLLLLLWWALRLYASRRFS